MVCLILARGGSKGVPKKNIKILGEKPLIKHVIDAANKTKNISDIFVSSDCEEILEISKESGAKIIVRPKDLAQDLSKDIDSFKHAHPFLGKPKEIIQLRATTPLIEPYVLDDAINFFNENKKLCTSMRSVHKTSDSVLKFYCKEDNFLVNICKNNSEIEYSSSPRQSVPATYCPNGYIDILKAETFFESKTFYGDKVLCYETKFTPEVDTMDDFDYIEYIYNKKFNNV